MPRHAEKATASTTSARHLPSLMQRPSSPLNAYSSALRLTWRGPRPACGAKMTNMLFRRMRVTEPMNVGFGGDLFAIVYIAKEHRVSNTLLLAMGGYQAITVLPSGAYSAGSDFGKDGEAVGW